ncbi:hypothetical protein EV138_0525 [Kribbella voronezhensis]|uniref:Uncharacterized protein n=1 Tax=Kribbella voronezhensis TaxID=2512212 RepID=A0A4R7T7B0_9ACTN|nr:hypothetical protein [Kribbella voronezhensis]TDU87008.1 hypothetical protein EV138_0525 [Kribbella voronezhensis]
MNSVSSRVLGAAAALACLVVGLVAAFAVDGRLDRQWVMRGITMLLAFGCAAVVAADQGRRTRRIIGLIGVLMFGLVFPVTATIWSKPPEIDFALKVADDANAAASKAARSTVTVEDVRTAAVARGGAVGTLKTEKSPEIRGAGSFPLILRAKPDQGRPRACLSYTGLDAKVRPC